MKLQFRSYLPSFEWCEYFDGDRDKALDYFIESITQTHLKGHLT